MPFDLFSRFRKSSADDAPATVTWPLYAFGKLPVYKDFISVGLADDTTREFRDWLSNGFSRLWSSRDEYRESDIPLHAFLIRLPGSRKEVAGALWGSHDQGGLRKFPFALFSILPSGRGATSVLTALDYLPVFEGRAREIRQKYDAGGTLEAVYRDLRGAKIEIPIRTPDQVLARLTATLSAFAIGRLARELFLEKAPIQWPLLLSGLEAAARRPTEGAGAFRLRLADKPPPPHQLQLWTALLTKDSSNGAAPTGVLYRTGGEVPCGVFFFRDLRAEDILLLHPAAEPTDFVEEIPRHSRRSSREVESERPVAAMVAAPAETIPPLETVPETVVAATRPADPQNPGASETSTPSHATDGAVPSDGGRAESEGPAAEPAGWDLPLSSLLGGP